jgi:hypothetical protein
MLEKGGTLKRELKSGEREVPLSPRAFPVLQFQWPAHVITRTPEEAVAGESNAGTLAQAELRST